MVYSSAPFGQGFQTRVNRYPDAGFPGLIREVRSSVNAIYPVSAGFQLAAVTLGTVVANTNYVFTVNGYSVTVNSGALNDAAFKTAVIAALQADSQINGLFVVTAGATTVVNLTHRVRGASEVVTVSGGAAAVAITEPTAQSILPLGRVVVIDSATDLDGELPSIKLPAGASPGPFGVCGLASHAYPRLTDSTGKLTPGFRPGEALSVARIASIWMPFEAAVGAGAAVYYRHTADGALDVLGGLAPASGTGLALLAGATTTGPSTLTSTGELIAPVDINLP